MVDNVSMYIYKGSQTAGMHSSVGFISYSDWCKKVNLLATKYRESDAENWLLFDIDSYQFSLQFFAMLVAGKNIFLPPNQQPETIKQLEKLVDANSSDIFDSSMNLIVTENESAEFAINKQQQVTIFTSGSSGQPKLIVKHVWQLLNEINELQKLWGEEVDDQVTLSFVSHQHIYGLLFRLMWPVLSHRDLVVEQFEYPEHLVAKALEFNRSICIVGSPAHFTRLVGNNVLADLNNSLGLIFSSGGNLATDKAVALNHELSVNIVEVFGSSETGGIGWRQQPEPHCTQWQPFSTVKVSYDTKSQQLKIKSNYLQDVDSWYLCDDRIDLHENGKFNLLGRIDRIVKIEEKRLSLDEMEQQLSAHAFVKNVFVTLIQNTRLQVVAAVELSELGQEKLALDGKLAINNQLKSHLTQTFERVTLPKKWRYVGTLPYNAQGKLIKSEVEEMFNHGN